MSKKKPQVIHVNKLIVKADEVVIVPSERRDFWTGRAMTKEEVEDVKVLDVRKEKVEEVFEDKKKKEKVEDIFEEKKEEKVEDTIEKRKPFSWI